MSSQAMRASPRADMRAHARKTSHGRFLRRFRPKLREPILALIQRHERLADLCESFPALLVALACPRAKFDREPVIQQVIVGAPLDTLAARALVPMWLRRMPPQMLVGPLPLLPDSPFIRHRIVNHFPQRPQHAEAWFDAVSRGNFIAHQGFAVWCARVFAGKTNPRQRRRLRGLALWAWYSSRVHDAGHALIEKPWTPEILLPAALASLDKWCETVQLECNLGNAVVGDVWLKPAVVDGYEFVPLRTAAAIADEARVMRNCLRTYGDAVTHNQSRLWSVRKDGARVATLEVGFSYDPLPVVVEVKLANNARAPVELWWAARKWLNTHDLPSIAIKRIEWDTVPLDRARWQEIWKPYWLAKGVIPNWLPLVPPRYGIWHV